MAPSPSDRGGSTDPASGGLGYGEVMHLPHVVGVLRHSRGSSHVRSRDVISFIEAGELASASTGSLSGFACIEVLGDRRCA
jgi:hypothetical protein